MYDFCSHDLYDLRTDLYDLRTNGSPTEGHAEPVPKRHVFVFAAHNAKGDSVAHVRVVLADSVLLSR